MVIGKTHFNVFYNGNKIDATALSFNVLSNGYAKDTFNTYYRGKKSMMGFKLKRRSRRKSPRKSPRKRRSSRISDRLP